MSCMHADDCMTLKIILLYIDVTCTNCLGLADSQTSSDHTCTLTLQCSDTYNNNIIIIMEERERNIYNFMAIASSPYPCRLLNLDNTLLITNNYPSPIIKTKYFGTQRIKFNAY